MGKTGCESAPEVDDEEYDYDMDIVGADPEKILQLLSDRGEFAQRCDDALAAQGGSISDAASLAAALSEICAAANLESVDQEEAAGMLLPNLTPVEFKHLCREYFESLARVLDCTDTCDGMLPASSPRAGCVEEG
eukprot:TRINITY_DN2344_c0_g1_i1.p1 TRINITY_DN2344_c0_g1~~TRINITY_DN2344_c0_g1_i1.p1  ORF type:complete len:135 (+),score=28.42 TRINITY_DN2344_c0_g1_i1:82-486(+)